MLTSLQSSFQQDQISTLKAFGETLVRLGSRNKNIVVLNSNSSKMFYTHFFAQTFPDRHFNFGNGYNNIMSAAAGFTVRGKIPIVCNFAMSVTSAVLEQIRNNICYPYVNVKIIGSYTGIFNGESGAAYQALEDMAIMRTLPNMKVLCPCDSTEAKKMLEVVMNDYGPTYLRLSNETLPVLYDDYDFEIGKGSIYKSGTDICIFSIGSAVSNALEAASILEREGLSTMVVNLSTLQPIDENLIIECVKQAEHIVTVEDHQIVGGLGSAVCEVLSSHYPCKVLRLGMNSFGESGKPQDLYRKYRLDPAGIYERIKEEISS